MKYLDDEGRRQQSEGNPGYYLLTPPSLPLTTYRHLLTACCPLLSGTYGGFVPHFRWRRSFVIKQIGGFVFQKALSFQPLPIGRVSNLPFEISP